MPSIRASAVLIALHNSLRSGLGDLRCRGVGDRFQGAVQSGVRHEADRCAFQHGPQLWQQLSQLLR